VLAYSAARFVLFVAALALLSLAGLRSIVLVVAALLASGLLSYWLLSRPRQEMSLAVAGRLSRIRSGLDDSAASEDDEAYVDEAAGPATLTDGPRRRETGG
jgi:hypothetical protein